VVKGRKKQHPQGGGERKRISITGTVNGKRFSVNQKTESKAAEKGQEGGGISVEHKEGTHAIPIIGRKRGVIAFGGKGAGGTRRTSRGRIKRKEKTGAGGWRLWGEGVIPRTKAPPRRKEERGKIGKVDPLGKRRKRTCFAAKERGSSC